MLYNKTSAFCYDHYSVANAQIFKADGKCAGSQTRWKGNYARSVEMVGNLIWRGDTEKNHDNNIPCSLYCGMPSIRLDPGATK